MLTIRAQRHGYLGIPDWAAPLSVAGADRAADGVPGAMCGGFVAGGAVVLAAEAPAQAGKSMCTKEFLSKLEHDRIVKAIREQEARSSGKSASISSGSPTGDPLKRRRNDSRNPACIKRVTATPFYFVVPRAHKFAVVGDQEIMRRKPSAIASSRKWRRTSSRKRFSDAIVDVI